MKSRILLSGVGVIMVLLSAVVGAEDFSRPKNHLGDADSEGKLSFWLDLDDVVLSDGSKLPVRLKFTTETTGESLPLGLFWRCPLIQSTAILLDERNIEFQTLGGRKVYLHRNQNRDGEFISGDRVYQGKSGPGGSFSIIGRGWQYEFQNGILKSARSGQGITLEWLYNGGRFQSIIERGRGEVLSFSYLANEPLPIAININRKAYAVSSQNVPVVRELMGQSLVSGYSPTISEVSRDQEKHVYSITLKDSETYSLDYKPAAQAHRNFTWRSYDGTLISSDQWTYRLVEEEGKPSIMERVNKEGQMESYWYDSRTGTSEYRDPVGAVTVRKYFTGYGPAQHKIRSMQQTLRGKEIFNMKWAYDEAGRLVRRISGDTEWNWERYSNGKVSKVIKSQAGKEIERRLYNENGRLSEKIRGETTYRYLQEEGKTVVQQIKNGIVTSALLREKGRGENLFAINGVEVEQRASGFNLEKTEEIDRARDLIRRTLLQIKE